MKIEKIKVRVNRKPESKKADLFIDLDSIQTHYGQIIGFDKKPNGIKKAAGELDEIGECHQQIQKWLRERNKLSLKTNFNRKKETSTMTEIKKTSVSPSSTVQIITHGFTVVHVEPINEIPVKNLSELTKIYDASQAAPKENIYPIFRIDFEDDDILYLGQQQPETNVGPAGYYFYLQTDFPEGEHEYYVDFNEDGSGVESSITGEGEICPDQLIYTGQNFSIGKHAQKSNPDEIIDFSVFINGEEIKYHAWQADLDDLSNSNDIVLGAWYFAPTTSENSNGDGDDFPFSDGYKSLEAAKVGAKTYSFETMKPEI